MISFFQGKVPLREVIIQLIFQIKHPEAPTAAGLRPVRIILQNLSKLLD
jgi:hypothetical protein